MEGSRRCGAMHWRFGGVPGNIQAHLIHSTHLVIIPQTSDGQVTVR